MNPAEATREVFWNITHIGVMYALLAPTLFIAGYGVWQRLAHWRRGRPRAGRWDRPGQRLWRLVQHALLQRRTLADRYAGTFHLMLFWGFFILTVATTVVMVHEDFHLPIMHGAFYLYFQSLTVDLFGLVFMVGLALAGWRRWKSRPGYLVFTDEASWILVLLFVIAGTGFLLEGWRIAVTNDPWGTWSPVGYSVALASRGWVSDGALQWTHRLMWWFHLVLVFGFIAWAPYTKMAHVLMGPLNIYTASLEPIGAALQPIDFEEERTLGVRTLTDFTWKDLADLDACTECGRCTAVCPANDSGKQLSPRDLILDLQHLARSDDADYFTQSRAGTTGESVWQQPLHEATSALSAEALWECTTCAACMQACPVFIEQMPKIVDLRRYLVMEEAELPAMMQEAITSLETRGHPFRGTQSTRTDWAEGLNIPTVADQGTGAIDVLLWVGCGGALIERNQKIVRALAGLLKHAGVRFAILGREEKCTGDPARRIGHEFLFESLAKENLDTLQRHQIRTIVTSCPHCFNTLRNEYPALGGNFEVFHHSEYLQRLVHEGRIRPEQRIEAQVTFHDPCYLGRQNGIFDAPRELVQISSTQKPVEMSRHGANSFCCGGGGGLTFIDEPAETRVNRNRAQEAVASGADILAVGCPFCMTQLEDGVKGEAAADRPVRVLDVAELLWETVRTTGES